jgi:hypothetical protein
MNSLTEKQIDYITQVVNESTIQSEAMKEDLIDHFCCAIEADMQKGASFETAYNKAYYYICPDGFDEIQRETIFLLTLKNIQKMKKLLYFSGYLSAIGMTTGLSMMLSESHVDNVSFGNGRIVLFATVVILVFVFLPTLFMHLYKKDLAQFYGKKMMYAGGFTGVAFLVLSLFFTWMHWPLDSVFLLTALVAVNFAFFPMLFLKMYRKTC